MGMTHRRDTMLLLLLTLLKVIEAAHTLTLKGKPTIEGWAMSTGLKNWETFFGFDRAIFCVLHETKLYIFNRYKEGTKGKYMYPNPTKMIDVTGKSATYSVGGIKDRYNFGAGNMERYTITLYKDKKRTSKNRLLMMKFDTEEERDNWKDAIKNAIVEGQ